MLPSIPEAFSYERMPRSSSLHFLSVLSNLLHPAFRQGGAQQVPGKVTPHYDNRYLITGLGQPGDKIQKPPGLASYPTCRLREG